MQPSPDAFWTRIRLYREMGLDPLKWIAGCSVEVDREEVLFPALAGARDALAALGVTVDPREGPDLLELRGAPVAPQRIIVRRARPSSRLRDPRRGNPRRAAVTMRVHQKDADAPDAFGRELVGAVENLPGRAKEPENSRLDDPITIGRLHAVATPHESGAFALFDFYESGGGKPRGYTAVNSDTLQVADATLDPTAEEHADAVIAAALSGALSLGAFQNLSLYPILDAAGKKTVDGLAANFQAAARRHGLALVDRPAIGTGKLLIGATVTAETDREVPNKHVYVKRGMEVTVTRPFGELAPLATYLSCLSDDDYRTKLEAAGQGLASLARARDATAAALTTPATPAAEVIHDFSPPFQEPPELKQHVAATLDLAFRGALAFPDFARRFGVVIRLGSLPLSHPEVSAFATSAYLMDNATASAPGAFAIVAWPSVLEDIEPALEAKGLRPLRVGEVTGFGAGTVMAPAGFEGAVASKRLLGEFVLEAAQGGVAMPGGRRA